VVGENTIPAVGRANFMFTEADKNIASQSPRPINVIVLLYLRVLK